MKFPELFSISKSGKQLFWSIEVEDLGSNSMTTTNSGHVGGKIQTNNQTTFIGKNIGKKNETTHYQQAVNEARSKWNKKIDMMYKEKTSNSSITRKTSKNQTTLLPMLALDYHKRGKDIVFPCFVQPKIDGARAIYNNRNLYSRTGKEFPKINHILNELKSLKNDIVLDGELYSNNMTFQETIGAIKKNKPESKDIIYIVYDLIDTSLNYLERYKLLETLLKKSDKVVLIKTEICKSSKDVITYHNKYVSQGYEGLILRNFKAKYMMKHRSKDLQKYKNFMDDEFEITGATTGSGKEKDLVIWIVKTKSGKLFNVRPKGSYEERKTLFKDANKHIGKKITVRYFELTDEGIPRFPVGVGIRDYE